MSAKHFRDFGIGAAAGAAYRLLAPAAHAARAIAGYLLNSTGYYLDRFGRKLPDRRSTTRRAHNPRSNCDELREEHIQLLAKYELLKESLADERIVKAETEKELVDLQANHVTLDLEHQRLYNELLSTRRNRDRLRDENALLKNRISTMKRLNALVRDAYTQMASAYLQGVADERLIKRAKKWLEEQP